MKKTRKTRRRIEDQRKRKREKRGVWGRESLGEKKRPVRKTITIPPFL